MGEILDYFLCDKCQCKDLELVFNFGLRFRKVNFSDELIYDELTEEKYRCASCKKEFTKREIEEALGRIKEMHRGR
jgi:hypothetical protein